jgi:hypothetical protein
MTRCWLSRCVTAHGRHTGHSQPITGGEWAPGVANRAADRASNLRSMRRPEVSDANAFRLERLECGDLPTKYQLAITCGARPMWIPISRCAGRDCRRCQDLKPTTSSAGHQTQHDLRPNQVTLVIATSWSRRADLNRGPADYEIAARENPDPLHSIIYGGSRDPRVCWEASSLLQFVYLALSHPPQFSPHRLGHARGSVRRPGVFGLTPTS